MGGQGSTRWGDRPARPRTWEATSLSVGEVVRAAPVIPGWRSGGTLPRIPATVTIEPTQWEWLARALLDYKVFLSGDWHSRHVILPLVATRPGFGGARWWFICPRCGRRVGIVYFCRWHGVSGDWACRRCHGLAYDSQWDTRRRRADRRWLQALWRAGGTWGERSPRRPKGMHQHTYEKCMAELCAAALERARTKGKGLAWVEDLWGREDVDRQAEAHAYDAVCAWLSSRPQPATRPKSPQDEQAHPGVDYQTGRRLERDQWIARALGLEEPPRRRFLPPRDGPMVRL